MIDKKLTSKDATHLLQCSHCFGRSRKKYLMKCIVIKEMPDTLRLKVLVFGDLFWGGEQQKIRYINKHRVKPILEIARDQKSD